MASSFQNVIAIVETALDTHEFQKAYDAILKDASSIERMVNTRMILTYWQRDLLETIGEENAKGSSLLDNLPTLPSEACRVATSIFLSFKGMTYMELSNKKGLQLMLGHLNVVVDNVEFHNTAKDTRLTFTIENTLEQSPVALLHVPKKEADLVIMTDHEGKRVHVTAKNYVELDAKYAPMDNKIFLSIWIGTPSEIKIRPDTMYVLCDTTDKEAHFLSLPLMTEEAARLFLATYGPGNEDGMIPILLPSSYFFFKLDVETARRCTSAHCVSS